MGVKLCIMWRLVVSTVFIFSSTAMACYKPVEIDNQLDLRIKAVVQFDDQDEFVYTGFIESGAVWTEDDSGKDSRRRRLISAVYADTWKNGKKVQACVLYGALDTGYWYFKVEYKDKKHKEYGCQVTRIGGYS